MIKRNLGFVKIILVGVVCFAIGGCMANSTSTKASSNTSIMRSDNVHKIEIYDDTENKNTVYVVTDSTGIAVTAVPKH